MNETKRVVQASAHPNLALVKYWGKSDPAINLPATSSIGISLKTCLTTTLVSKLTPEHRPVFRSAYQTIPQSMNTTGLQSEESSLMVGAAEHGLVSNADAVLSWQISIDGRIQDANRFRAFFQSLLTLAMRQNSRLNTHLQIESNNNFPIAAGLASSASGFAALAGAVERVLRLDLDLSQVSSLARVGSASASRSVFGGFVDLPRRAHHACQLFTESHWPELCCIIIIIERKSKPISSREAMERCRLSSPFYESWLNNARVLYEGAREAVSLKDIEQLGIIMRQSYMAMFATMFTTKTPIILWQPMSLEILQILDEMRSQGIPAFETMDAGPQIKVLTLREHCSMIMRTIKEYNSRLECRVTDIGGPLEVWDV